MVEPYDCDEELICPKAESKHVEDEVHGRAVVFADLKFEYFLWVFSDVLNQNVTCCNFLRMIFLSEALCSQEFQTSRVMISSRMTVSSNFVNSFLPDPGVPGVWS